MELESYGSTESAGASLKEASGGAEEALERTMVAVLEEWAGSGVEDKTAYLSIGTPVRGVQLMRIELGVLFMGGG